MIKLYLTICLYILAPLAYGQENKYDLGAPIALKQTGWNKVLCMKNGNTMLFNLDRNMPVTVKVFDSSHKEKASQKTYVPATGDIKDGNGCVQRPV